MGLIKGTIIAGTAVGGTVFVLSKLSNMDSDDIRAIGEKLSGAVDEYGGKAVGALEESGIGEKLGEMPGVMDALKKAPEKGAGGIDKFFDMLADARENAEKDGGDYSGHLKDEFVDGVKDAFGKEETEMFDTVDRGEEDRIFDSDEREVHNMIDYSGRDRMIEEARKDLEGGRISTLERGWVRDADGNITVLDGMTREEKEEIVKEAFDDRDRYRNTGLDVPTPEEWDEMFGKDKDFDVLPDYVFRDDEALFDPDRFSPEGPDGVRPLTPEEIKEIGLDSDDFSTEAPDGVEPLTPEEIRKIGLDPDERDPAREWIEQDMHPDGMKPLTREEIEEIGLDPDSIEDILSSAISSQDDPTMLSENNFTQDVSKEEFAVSEPEDNGPELG